MVLKFLTAGVISAVLAGAAMYLAMDEDTLLKLRSGPNAVASSEAGGPSAEGQGQTGVIDRLLGRDDPNSAAADPEPVAEDTTAPDSRIGQPVEDGMDTPRRGWLDDYLPRRDTVPIPTRPNPDQPPPVDASVFDALVEQAGLLEIPDARDDAYLSILNFALAEERYEVADDIVARLSAPPLRDTARQRIGISHAQAGRMDEAFAVLDGIEIEELADPIRLEIIRSVTLVRQPG